jgi:hypothetical protein
LVFLSIASNSEISKSPLLTFSKGEILFRWETQNSPVSPAGGGMGWIFKYCNYLVLFIHLFLINSFASDMPHFRSAADLFFYNNIIPVGINTGEG